MLRGGKARRRFIGLITYYAMVVLLVGPVFFTPVEADTTPRIPVLLSLNVALRTHTTDVATFTTPFPLTVEVAGNGVFTIAHDRLGFAPVDVPFAARTGLSPMTVRARPIGDFAGTVDTTTGTVTLDGFLELSWTKPNAPAGELPIVNCPVGPFALNLSTATPGGADLNRQSLQDPTSRTARLVDDHLAIDAIPDGTKACGGVERKLNAALSLPIVPPVVTTTTTAAPVTTIPETTIPETTTVAPTTVPETTTEAPSTTIPPADPVAPTTTVDPTTIAPVDGAPVEDPGATSTTVDTTPPVETMSPTTAPNAAPAPTPGLGPVPDGLGIALDPNVISLEPIPSVVSTFTIAAVPVAPANPTPTSQPRPAPTVPQSRVTLNRVDPHAPRHRSVVVAPRRSPKKPNKHAQTSVVDPAVPTVIAHNSTPPLYFSPLNFGGLGKSASSNPVLSPAPFFGLGANAIAKHRDLASILFLALVLLPVVALSFGLVAADFGIAVPFLGRAQRRGGRRSGRRGRTAGTLGYPTVD